MTNQAEEAAEPRPEIRHHPGERRDAELGIRGIPVAGGIEGQHAKTRGRQRRGKATQLAGVPLPTVHEPNQGPVGRTPPPGGHEALRRLEPLGRGPGQIGLLPRGAPALTQRMQVNRGREAPQHFVIVGRRRQGAAARNRVREQQVGHYRNWLGPA